MNINYTNTSKDLFDLFFYIGIKFDKSFKLKLILLELCVPFVLIFFSALSIIFTNAFSTKKLC